MLPVAPHRRGQGQAKLVHHGCDRAPDHTKTGVPLANVMEERGDDGLVLVREQGHDPVGHLESVTLIGGSLRPEQLRSGLGEAVVDDLLFPRAQPRCGDGAEESQDQVFGMLPSGHA